LQQISRIGLKGVRHLRKRQFLRILSYDRTALPAYKALPEESRPYRLMSLVLSFQAGSDSSPVSERLRTAVLVGLLRSVRRCWVLTLGGTCVPPTVKFNYL